MTNIPWAPIVAFLAFAAGAGLAVAGVFVLYGVGDAMITGAVFCFVFAAIILRGLMRG
jgi:hypothetical protein